MTGAFETSRAGAIVEHVTACSRDPACVCVALLKGLRVSPLVRDSRAFGLCALGSCSKLLAKKFGPDGESNIVAPQPRHEPDPFDSLVVTTLTTKSPILTGAIAALDCEVVRHLDFDGDHELFVGRVLAAVLRRDDHVCGGPAVSG